MREAALDENVRPGLRGAGDQEIWDFAREQGLMIVSKDTDFRERSYVEGFPPKIIWADVGNAGTASIFELLRRERQRICQAQKAAGIRGARATNAAGNDEWTHW